MAENGHNRLIFEKPLEAKHICTSCDKGLKKPMQAECGHRFCHGCLSQIQRSTHPVCPLDNMTLTRDGAFMDKYCEREMRSLMSCCPNQDSECGWSGQLDNLESHLATECPYKACQYCSGVLPESQLKEHFTKCWSNPVTCPACDQENIPRIALQSHLSDICTQAEISCPFKEVGCDFKGKRGELFQHVTNGDILHLSHVENAQKAKEQANNQAWFERLKGYVVNSPKLPTEDSEEQQSPGPCIENTRGNRASGMPRLANSGIRGLAETNAQRIEQLEKENCEIKHKIDAMEKIMVRALRNPTSAQ